MHKILIIEDRSARKEKFLDDSIKIELDKYLEDLLFLEGEKYAELKLALTNNDMSFFDKFGVIVTHRSAFEHNLLDKIKEYSRQNNKPLVFFSGGISTSYYDETVFQFLTINSKDFYSINLVHFLNRIKEIGEIELPILQYGYNWELNYLMEARNSIANYLYANPGATQVTRNIIENEIKLKGRILKVLTQRSDVKWVTEGIKENADQKLSEILISIKEEINEYIKRL